MAVKNCRIMKVYEQSGYYRKSTPAVCYSPLKYFSVCLSNSDIYS